MVDFFTGLEFLLELGLFLPALFYCDGLLEGWLFVLILAGLDCKADDWLLVVTWRSS